MKTELAKKLLKDIIEPILPNEDEAERIFSELHFLAEYKYDHYEMYAPGRRFLEHLYIWLKQFEPHDRKIALDLVRNNLIFISRREFEMLSDVLYYETVKKIHFDIVSKENEIPRYKVRKIAESDALTNIERRSLYIGMSDGARIDYFRRQNKSIGNEQVLTSYHVDKSKCDDMVKKLEDDCGKGERFRLLFLLDDFCASGRTLIRLNRQGELNGTLSQLESKVFNSIIQVDEKNEITKSALLDSLLSKDCEIYLCPMLATQKSVEHIDSIKNKLDSQLKSLKVMPTAILEPDLSIDVNDNGPINKLCEKYYQNRMADEHTGDVTYGYDKCGLTLVLHHNTPNNSIYLFWNRRGIEREKYPSLFSIIYAYRAP